MRYRLVLFDADDTLFDFGRAEEHAFGAMLADMLPQRAPVPTASPVELFALYRSINARVWEELERGLLRKDQLNHERFRRFWAAVGVSVSAGESAARYVAHLSQCSFLLEGAVETCRTLRERGCRLGIVTNGLQQVQRSRLACSPLATWMDFMVVSDECGYPKPDPRILAYTLTRHPLVPNHETLLVGDKLETDVQVSNAFGIASCWFNPARRPNGTAIRPTYEVHALEEVPALVIGGGMRATS